MTDSPEKPNTVRPPVDAVFRAYRTELHRWLRKRLRSPDAADDVMQEVFTRILRIDSANYVRKPLPYLFGIAFHVISEFRIRDDNERTVSIETLTEAQINEDPTFTLPDDLADQLNLHRQLEKALLELPQHYRTVVLLCKRDGMTYEEAAAASGLSVHTVETYLIRAKARLMALAWDR